MTVDPIEKIIADALDGASVAYTYTRDGEGDNSGLDFRLTGVDVYIECKQFHTARAGEQMSRVENIICIQGRRAAEVFAAMITNKKD